MAEGILRIISSQVLDTVSQMPEEEIKSKNFDSLVKSAVALTRAAAYKRDADNVDLPSSNYIIRKLSPVG